MLGFIFAMITMLFKAVVVTITFAIPLSLSADEPDVATDKTYGTPSPASIRITVPNELKERGAHYIPAGTKFSEFIKSLHVRRDIHVDPMHSFHVMRNGRRVCESYRTTMSGISPEHKEQFERFVLEDGDAIELTFYFW